MLIKNSILLDFGGLAVIVNKHFALLCCQALGMVIRSEGKIASYEIFM